MSEYRNTHATRLKRLAANPWKAYNRKQKSSWEKTCDWIEANPNFIFKWGAFVIGVLTILFILATVFAQAAIAYVGMR